MEKKPNSRRYCIAYGCLNSTVTRPDLSHFSLPRDSKRRREWLIAIDREDLLSKEDLKYKSYTVCSIHFGDFAIKTTKQLKNDALPTLFLHNEADTFHTNVKSVDVSVQTRPAISILSDARIKQETNACVETQRDITSSSKEETQKPGALTDKTPLKRKLAQELKLAKRRRQRLDYEIDRIIKELEETNTPITINPEDDIYARLYKLVEWQNKLKNKYRGDRCDAEYKMFALHLYYSSPQAYRWLQTILKLPSKETINKLKLKISPKLDDSVFNMLSLKLKSLPDEAKYCTICIDEMELKRYLYYDIITDEVIGFHNINGKISPEIATKAYVIMLQGLYFNWKQPIAYALLASSEHYEEFDLWMYEVIAKLFGFGIEIRAIISDQGSYFDKYAKEVKKVTVRQPYFFVDSRKIYYIFDVPHLLVCVRNDLLSNNFHYKEEVISWDYIKTLYADQKLKELRLIPKITDAHVEPKNLQGMCVKYATQIFSHTVYAALETYIDFERIPENARATAKFVKTMNDLFDVLNSSKINSAYEHQTALKMNAEQKKILQEAQSMFSNIKTIKKSTGKIDTSDNKTFHNFQITIQAIQLLFEDLKACGFNYILTRRLNQESYDNFFGSIRKQYNLCTYPKPIQLRTAFSKLFLCSMLKNSPSANCETDLYKILIKAEDLFNTNITIPNTDVKTSQVLLDGESDYRMDIPKFNALTYIAGYLVFKCSKRHHCDEMIEALKSMPAFEKTKLFAHYKAYNKNASFYGCLKMPPQELNQYVEKLETAFTSNFEKSIHNRPGSTIFELLKEISPQLLCSCFPIDYFLKLFIRLRIFATIRFNNRQFRPGNKAIKQYLKIMYHSD